MPMNSQSLPEISLLLAAERSGTHFLRSMLRNLSRVATPVEICNPATGDVRTAPSSFLRFCASARATDEKFCYSTPEIQTEMLDRYFDIVRTSYPRKKNIILDVKYAHLHNFNPARCEFLSCPFLLRYAIDRNMKIIHLVRRKAYRTIISYMYAAETGVWHVRTPGQPPCAKVRINLPTLQERTLRLCQTIGLVEHWLKGARKLTIQYETLTADTEACLASVGHFLGLDVSISARTIFVKSTPPYAQAIENFAEVRDLIDIDLGLIDITTLNPNELLSSKDGTFDVVEYEEQSAGYK